MSSAQPLRRPTAAGIRNAFDAAGLGDRNAELNGSAPSRPLSIGAYEIRLRFHDGTEELRLTDHLEAFVPETHTLHFGGQ